MQGWIMCWWDGGGVIIDQVLVWVKETDADGGMWQIACGRVRRGSTVHIVRHVPGSQ
jgi:hypothetical protein